MKYIMILLLCATSLFASEHFEVQVPQGWTVELEQLKENGRYFGIWTCGEERLVAVASPFQEGEEHSMTEIVSTMEDAMSACCGECKVFEVVGNEALLGCSIEGESILLSRVVATSEGIHIVSYCYDGSETSLIDQSSWQAFLKNVVITG